MSESYRLHIQGHGRVSIPAEVRRALNLDVGTEVFLRAEDTRVVITPIDDALARFQQAVAARIPAERDVVAELLTERRAEGARDD